MSHIKKWIVYPAFVIIAVVFLIYYLFPSEMVKRYIVFQVSNIHPDLEVSIGQVFPTFPPGLRLETVNFEYAGNPMLEAEQMRVKPKLASLLRTPKSFPFSLRAHGGQVIGNAKIWNLNKNGQFDIEASISGMQLAHVPVLKNQSVWVVSGVLGMEIRYQNGPDPGRTMRARIEILDVGLQSENLFSNPVPVSLERIEAELSMRDRRIELESCYFTGDQFDGVLSGFGILKNPIDKSTLALSGRLNPQLSFLSQQKGNLPPAILNALKPEAQEISILIRGSIENPSFSFE